MSPPPVDPRSFADPFVLVVGDVYYAYATNAGGVNVQVRSSADLADWVSLPDALPALPGWAGPNFTWSPSVLPRSGGYVLYYAVRQTSTGRQVISAATSPTPDGPFVDSSAAPLIAQAELGGSIDPSPYVDADGTAYLLWKSDANAIGRPSSLWIQPVADDGLALTGSPSRLLDVGERWERPLIEAPCLVAHAGTYHLFYSANWWDTRSYAVGYATSARLLGPYVKQTEDGPWFASDGQVDGPGGQELFVDSHGGWRMAYHGWPAGGAGARGAARSLRIVPVSFGSGRPEVAG